MISNSVTSSKKTTFSSLLQRLGSCSSSRVLTILSASVVVALLPAVACALPILLDADFSIYLVSGNDWGGFVSEHFSSPRDSPGVFTLGGASVTVSGLPRPSLVGESAGVDHLLSGFPILAQSDVSMTYHFDVDPPPFETEEVLVPMLVVWTLQLDASGTVPGGGADGNATFTLRGPDPSDSDAVFSIARSARLIDNNGNLFSPPGFPAHNSGSQNFVLLSDTVGDVSIGFELRAIGDGYEADALVDPYISIDPDWLLVHPGYSVRVSEGIGNIPPSASAVPEPATLVLVGLGLAGMGLGRRRHERKR